MNTSLSLLQTGAIGKIVQINSPELEMHLMNMGVLIGDVFTLSNIAPFGGPFAISINGTKISFRKKDAAHIIIEPQS